MTNASGMGVRKYLSRRLLPLAVGTGLLFALLAPSIYWVMEHRNLRHITSLYAVKMAETFRALAMESPVLWKYQTYKFMQVTEEFHPPDIDLIGFRLLDENAAPVPGYDNKSGREGRLRELTFMEELSVTQGSAPIAFNNRRIGTIEIIVSDARLMRTTYLLLGLCMLLGMGLAALMYRFPVRVVGRQEREIEELVHSLRKSEDNLQMLNAQLETKVEEKTRQLLEAREELVRKEKLSILGQLSGSVGHELRNPLGVMSNAVYFLKMVLADSDETTKEYLEIIKQEIDNSQRIITDLLDFARTKTPQVRPIAVNKLISQSLEKCAVPENVKVRIDVGAIHAVGANLCVRPSPHDSPLHEQTGRTQDSPLLHVDPFQMSQVLQNLISNGVQAMPEGGTLRISAKTGTRDRGQGTGKEKSIPSPGTDFIEISVSDTGTGISPENMKNLFQPLFTTKAKGIGLGLVVCRNLTEANGGRIEVTSEPGKGTTFGVILPVEA